MKYYNENADEFFQNTIDVDMSELYEKFENYLELENEIIDIGCGSGRDSKYFIEKGYKVTATDISSELGKLAEKVIGQEVIIENVLDMIIKEKYNGVWACASLLHVNKNEMEKAFSNIYNALKPNGIFYCSFKYGDGEIERNGRLFNNYTEETMNELVNKTKFEMVSLTTTQDVRPTRQTETWLNLLLKKPTNN